MTVLDPVEIKKLKRGEIIGNIATAFCAVVLVYFLAGFSSAYALDMTNLKIIVSATSGGLIAAGIAVAAYCSIKFGGAIERLIGSYVRDVFVENAANMHPERDSLTFYLKLTESRMEIKVNNFKELIVFDFSAFGKLSAMRKMNIFSAVETRLTVSFIRLFERGGKYDSVSYSIQNGSRRKKGKTIFIIENGNPEKHSMKLYMKNK